MTRSSRFAAGFAALVVLVSALAFVLGHLGVQPQRAPEPGPNELSSGVLVESPDEYDCRTITFTGEAIGEAMVRGEWAWIHLNDDAYYLDNVEEGAGLGGYNSGMAVWLPAELASQIQYFGDFRHAGDVVTVRGTVNAACVEHGGDYDIHADSLVVEKVGRTVEDSVEGGKILWAAGLGFLALAGYLVDRYWLELSARLDRR
jgi:hypothetical protein